VVSRVIVSVAGSLIFPAASLVHTYTVLAQSQALSANVVGSAVKDPAAGVELLSEIYHPVTHTLSVSFVTIASILVVLVYAAPDARVRVGVAGFVMSTGSDNTAVSIVFVKAFQALSVQEIVIVSHGPFDV